MKVFGLYPTNAPLCLINILTFPFAGFNFPMSTSSAEQVAGNGDLLTEIFLRTPVKPLLRFRSVSKRWLSLISDPHFCHRHARRSSASVPGVLLGLPNSNFDFISFDEKKASEPPLRSLDFIGDPLGVKVLQVCNGLLCCSTVRSLGTSRNYYICNLATRRFSVLPPPCSSGGRDTVFGINLAFDPSKSPYYSVICVRSCEVSISHYQIEIYSSGTGDWRLSGKPFRAPFDMVFYDGVFWNGAVHWISPSGASLYFGIDEGRIDTMPPPPPGPGGWGKRRIRHFGESGGHLHIIEIYGPRTTQFVVYEMERDYSNWGVRFSVDLDKVIAAFPEITQNYLDAHDLYYYAYNVLCLIRGGGGNEEDFSLLLQIRGKIICYNIKDGSFKNVYDVAHGNPPALSHVKASSLIGCLEVYPYMETLTCV